MMRAFNRLVPAVIIILICFSPVSAQNGIQLRDEVRTIPAGERVSLFSFHPSKYNELLNESETKRLDHLLQSGLVKYRLETRGAGFTASIPGKLPVGITTDHSGTLIYSAILYTDDPDAVRASGIEVNTVMPGFVTARIRENQLELLSQIDAVSAAGTGDILYPMMDQSLYETNAHLLHSAHLNGTRYTGEGALVAVFDTGVDWEHPNFRDPEDSTRSRILYLWDVTLDAEEGENTPAGNLDYGVEYTREQIEAAFSDSSLVRSRDTNGHGTHVLGSAAASGLFKGIAPEAGIIVIRGGVNSFSLSDIINGLEYARQKAEQLGKPVVVNLSIGGRVGPRDGTRADEIAIDILSANSGYVVVTSAGNDGSRNLHKPGNTGVSGSSLTIRVPDYIPNSGTENDQFAIDIWMDTTDSVMAKLSSPNFISYEAPDNTNTTFAENTDGTVYMYNNTVGNRRNIFLRVYDSVVGKEPAQGDWTVELTSSGDGISYQAWLSSFTVGKEMAELLDANNDYTITMPATSNEVITVGAYTVNRNFVNSSGASLSFVDAVNGDIAAFSSRGPTRDGRQKPEISAPGFGIRASLSQDENISNLLNRIMHGDRHIIKSGTSMSSPHVAGAVAVLLGANSLLTAAEAKNLLVQSASTDDFTGNLANNTWGAGKMDLLMAMRNMLNLNTDVATETIQYHNELANPSSIVETLDSNSLYAVRFSPALTGDISGFHLHTYDQVSSDGSIFFEVFTSSSGTPSIPAGQRVEVEFSEVIPSYYNYFDLSSSGAKVQADTEYHIVFGTSGGGSLNFLVDNGDGGHNRSIVFTEDTWQNITGETETVVREIASKIEITSGLLDASAVPVPDEVELPNIAELKQNYPNPFNPVTNITYSVPSHTEVNLSVYDVLGRRVARLVNETKSPGTYIVEWDAGTSASGVYIYRLEAAGQILTRKMTLVK